jgi:hypothetical protein
MTHYTLARRMAVAAFLVLTWAAAGLAQSAQRDRIQPRAAHLARRPTVTRRRALCGGGTLGGE